MRALILYHLVQAQAAERHRQAQRDAPARAASRARRTRPPRRRHRARGLPGVGRAPRAHRAGRRQQMTGRLTAHTHPAPAAACRPDRPRSSAGRDATVLAAATGRASRSPSPACRAQATTAGRGTRHLRRPGAHRPGR